MKSAEATAKFVAAQTAYIVACGEAARAQAVVDLDFDFGVTPVGGRKFACGYRDAQVRALRDATVALKAAADAAKASPCDSCTK